MSDVQSVVTIDPTLPDVLFDVEGNTYYLTYDFAAYFAFQKLTGKNYLEGSTVLLREDYAPMLFVGLLRKHPDITIEIVKSWFNLRTEGSLMERVGKAIAASLPDDQTSSTDVHSNPQGA